MNKRIYIIIVLLAILSFGGCGTKSESLTEEVAENTPELELSDNEASANSFTSEMQATELSTPDNSTVITSCEDCAVWGDRIYYINRYDDVTLYSMTTDGSDNRKLNDDWTTWFYVSGDQIYFQYGQEDGIYVMNIDGSGLQKLNDDTAWNVNVVGDKIFYSNRDDNDALYSMSIDGSDRKKLIDDRHRMMNVVEDRIYYYGEYSDNKGIYSVKMDGTDKHKLTNDSPFRMLVANGWIYYLNEDDDSKLYAIRTDGSDRFKVTDDYAFSLNVIGDRIYYKNENDYKMYRINTDGSDRKLLSDDKGDWLVASNNRIYYTMTGAFIYSMNLDGGDKQQLVDLISGVYKDVTYEVNASLREGMPEYRFVAKGKTDASDEWSRGYVMGLEVYDDNGLLLLAEDFSETYWDEVTGYPVYNLMMDTMGMHVTDVNFDGYKDVIILNDFSGAHSNTWYDCWIWNPETSSFVEAESFALIVNPALDPEKKFIYSTGGSGAGNQQWDIYQFMDGEFVVTNRVSYIATEKGYHVKEEELVHGEMATVRDVVIQGDNFTDALSAAGYIKDDLWQLDHPRWYGVGGHEADQWLE